MSTSVQTARRNSIGASDIPCIMGFSPFADAWTVFASKKGLIEIEETERMKWGKRLQEPIARGWSEDMGIPIEWYDKSVAHPKRKWQTCSPDALMPNFKERKAVVEVKTVSLDQAKEWGRSDEPWVEESDAIPDYVHLQVAWQMSVLDVEEAYVLAMIGGNRVWTYHLKRDLEIEAHML